MTTTSTVVTFACPRLARVERTTRKRVMARPTRRSDAISGKNVQRRKYMRELKQTCYREKGLLANDARGYGCAERASRYYRDGSWPEPVDRKPISKATLRCYAKASLESAAAAHGDEFPQVQPSWPTSGSKLARIGLGVELLSCCFRRTSRQQMCHTG